MITKTIISLFTLYQLSYSQPPPFTPIEPATPAQPNQPGQPAQPAQPYVPPLQTQSTQPVDPITIPPVITPPLITLPTDVPQSIQPAQPAQLQPDPSTITTATTTIQPTDPNAPIAPPDGYTYGYYGQLCMWPPLPAAQCQQMGQQLMSSQNMKCEKDFDCCLCGSVSCIDCQEFLVGNSGVLGVKLIEVNGRTPEDGGSSIGCKGSESCINADITGRNIRGIDCSGYGGCAGAMIRIFNPVTFFFLDCIGMGSCQGLTVELILPIGFTTQYETLQMIISRIACTGQNACDGLTFHIINEAKYPIIIENIDCLAHDSCNNARFDFSEYHSIGACQCGESCQIVSGIEKCFHNIADLFCNDPLSCRNAQRHIVNPTNGFIFKCAAINSCNNAQFTIELNPMGSNPSMFDGIMCNAPNACALATFIIDNQQLGAIEIEKLECTAKNSCKDATFVVGNMANFGQVYCVQGACDGCVIKTTIDGVGMPCVPPTNIISQPQPQINVNVNQPQIIQQQPLPNGYTPPQLPPQIQGQQQNKPVIVAV